MMYYVTSSVFWRYKADSKMEEWCCWRGTQKKLCKSMWAVWAYPIVMKAASSNIRSAN